MFNQSGKSRHIGDAFEAAFAKQVQNWFKTRSRRLILSDEDSALFYDKCEKLQSFTDVRGKMDIAALNAVQFALQQHERFFKPRGAYSLRLNDDASDPFDVRDCTIVNPNGEELGFSLKWRNDEIKSPRLQSDWMRKFYLPDDGTYERMTEPIVQQLSGFETWKEAKEVLGDDAVHVPFRDGLIYGINQIKDDKDASKQFCRFLFGSVRHVKVSVAQSMRKVHLADYDPDRLPTEVKYVEADRHSSKWAWLAFNEGWQLKFRLHSRETKIKSNVRSGMGLGVTVHGWGNKNPVQVISLPNANSTRTVQEDRPALSVVPKPPLHLKQRLPWSTAALSSDD